MEKAYYCKITITLFMTSGLQKYFVSATHTVKKKKLGKLKSLRQPASADFSQLLVLSLYNKKLRNFLKNKLRKLKNLLKLVALNF